MTRHAASRIRRLGALAIGLTQVGCAQLPFATPFGGSDENTCRDDGHPSERALYRAASEGLDAYYAREVARLTADLEQAEQQIIAIESGLRGTHTRADAVSEIADARIAVARATRRAPWRRDDTSLAADKLGEAERQLGAGHVASAVFFASRAGRIASTVNAEAKEVERHGETRFVQGQRVNLRQGPSTRHPVVDVLDESTPVFPERVEGQWALVRTVAGPIGWVHASLLRKP